MIELGMETNIAMCTILAGMAVYFVKSADLPRELKERAKMNARLGQVHFKREFSFNKNIEEKTEIKTNKVNVVVKKTMEEEALILATKMLEEKMNNARIMESKRKEANAIGASIQVTTKRIDFEKLNKRIDQITFAITTLEQELKTNNSKNNEIKNQIDKYLTELERLNSKKLA